MYTNNIVYYIISFQYINIYIFNIYFENKFLIQEKYNSLNIFFLKLFIAWFIIMILKAN